MPHGIDHLIHPCIIGTVSFPVVNDHVGLAVLQEGTECRIQGCDAVASRIVSDFTGQHVMGIGRREYVTQMHAGIRESIDNVENTDQDEVIGHIVTVQSDIQVDLIIVITFDGFGQLRAGPYA